MTLYSRYGSFRVGGHDQAAPAAFCEAQGITFTPFRTFIP